MILAGDIGGTSTRFGLFDPVRPRPRQLANRAFSTLDFPDLPSMIAAFFQAASEMGLEGIMAKQRHSKYLPGRRTDAWIKIKPKP